MEAEYQKNLELQRRREHEELANMRGEQLRVKLELERQAAMQAVERRRRIEAMHEL